MVINSCMTLQVQKVQSVQQHSNIASHVLQMQNRSLQINQKQNANMKKNTAVKDQALICLNKM